MKYVLVGLLLISCNVLKTLTDGETNPGNDFYQNNYCDETDTSGGTNSCHCDDSDYTSSCYVESLADNLEVFYDFDNSSDVGEDVSGKNLDLVFNSSNFTQTTGVFGGQGLSCANSSTSNNMYSPSASTNLSFGTTEDFSISLWINHTVGASSFDEIFTLYSSSSFGIITNISGFVALELPSYEAATSASVTSGAWENWIFIVDRTIGTVDIYKNGTFVNQVTSLSAGTSVTSDRVQICSKGTIGSVGSEFIDDVYLDEIGVWSRKLSSDEISRLNSGSYRF